MKISTFSYSDIGGRSCNEDSVQFKTAGEALLAVLADGLGGHGGGDIASGIAVRTLCEGWHGATTPAVLTELIQQAHRDIRSQQTPALAMKSTVVALALAPGHIDWAHVGDSRLYQFYNGALIRQTRDHSASQIAVMLGQITPEQIRFHEDRSRLFRALGQDGGLTVETGSAALEPGDYAFLLCSDGFWEYVEEAEMEHALQAAASVQDWVEWMHGLLSRRVPADNDNNTAAAVWLHIPEGRETI